MIDTVGGCNILLGIIAMAQDVESLYAGVKALTCVVRSNRAAQSEMDRKRSYQTLAMFFKKKRNLLNSHILHLTFSLVGTVNSGQESSAIPNITAFQVSRIFHLDFLNFLIFHTLKLYLILNLVSYIRRINFYSIQNQFSGLIVRFGNMARSSE